MKTLLLLLVVILCSCSSRSCILPQPLGPSEKVIIITMNPKVYNDMLRYKVKRLTNNTVTFIQISYMTIYAPKDTLLWRF